MTDPSPAEKARTRRRWIGFGEVVAVLAVVISALGLWKSWQSEDKPTTVVEQRQPIALALRAKASEDGRVLEIAPVEQGHALQSLTLRLTPEATIPVGSDGELSAGDVEDALGKAAEQGDGRHQVAVQVQADYVEAGVTRKSGGNYVLTYRWEGGGLLGGRSLRLVSLSR